MRNISVFKGKKVSNKALKPLTVMLFFLISASFLAPDVVQIWASTQKNDWRRDLAQEWSEPVGDLSRKTKISEIREISERIIENSKTEETIKPLLMPTKSTVRVNDPFETETSEQKTTNPVTTNMSTAPTYSETMVVDTTVLESSDSMVLPVGTSTIPLTTTTVVLIEDYTKPVREGTSGEPIKILAVGDSLMLDFQYGLERVLEPRIDVELEGRGALGFGFTVPHWDWEDDVIPDYNLMVGEVRPDVVVVMIGANEFQGYAIEGEDLDPGSARWREVLTERAHDAISHWLADGAYLYWWSTPKMSDPSFLVDDLNSVWEEVVSEWKSKAEMVDSMKVLGDEEGEFKWNMEMLDGSIIPLRKEHGVHFFEVGADALSRDFEQLLIKDGWLKNLSSVS